MHYLIAPSKIYLLWECQTKKAFGACELRTSNPSQLGFVLVGMTSQLGSIPIGITGATSQLGRYFFMENFRDSMFCPNLSLRGYRP